MNQIQKVMLFAESSQMSLMVEQKNHSLPSAPIPPTLPNQKRSIKVDEAIDLKGCISTISSHVGLLHHGG